MGEYGRPGSEAAPLQGGLTETEVRTQPNSRNQQPSAWHQAAIDYYAPPSANPERAPMPRLQSGVVDARQFNMESTVVRTPPIASVEISDANGSLNRDVFVYYKTGQSYHEVFITKADFYGSGPAVNLYDRTGYLITPVPRVFIGGLFNVRFDAAALSLVEAPNYSTMYRQNGYNSNSSATVDRLVEKYHRYAPAIKQLFKNF